MRYSYQQAENTDAPPVDGEDRLRQLVKLRTQRGRVLTAADEDRLLEEAVTRLGVSLERAHGILHAETQNGRIERESHLEETVADFIKSVAGSKKKLSRRYFEAMASYYASRRKVSLELARQAVKRLMEEDGIAPERAGVLMSKRWYRRVKA